MLWRALGDVAQGFWIDIGASDPVQHSVTRAFFERGWHGVNVEPMPAPFARLQAGRPGDINLNLAIGAANGRMVFYDCEDSSLATLEPAVAERNRADGRRVEARDIEVITLAELCRLQAPADIHFLKIDVEGAEAQVLAGADFATWRPWIILLEATIPLSQTDSSQDWEPGLLAQGYRFAWFDGLNRFYIAAERWDALAQHFRAPANVWDDYTLFDAPHAAECARLRAEISLLRSSFSTAPPSAPAPLAKRVARRLRAFVTAELRGELAQLRLEVARLAGEVAALRASQLRP
ncbi:MAG: FkbM family methyltransferase [Rhodospirillales bacterium]|nr:FkbM family methyltransferase [Rhodospirillales bacterium]MDE2200448.1 FkbM family methyltransferase [Rhodospirillales bacterium]